jgi:DNA-binding NarL/FixJ family response regulator
VPGSAQPELTVLRWRERALDHVTKREISALLTVAVAGLLAGRRYTSPRELLVYRLLGEGYGTPAIADELGVSRRTVDSYFARILEKLHAPGMEALRRRAAADWSLE